MERLGKETSRRRRASALESFLLQDRTAFYSKDPATYNLSKRLKTEM